VHFIIPSLHNVPRWDTNRLTMLVLVLVTENEHYYAVVHIGMDTMRISCFKIYYTYRYFSRVRNLIINIQNVLVIVEPWEYKLPTLYSFRKEVWKSHLYKGWTDTTEMVSTSVSLRKTPKPELMGLWIVMKLMYSSNFCCWISCNVNEIWTSGQKWVQN
jgi:hypothetical protein